jgi:hypothetical protein
MVPHLGLLAVIRPKSWITERTVYIAHVKETLSARIVLNVHKVEKNYLEYGHREITVAYPGYVTKNKWVLD